MRIKRSAVSTLSVAFIVLTTSLIAICQKQQTAPHGNNVESGTIILWDASPDAIVIAADSRIEKRINRPEEGDGDKQCKIIELAPHLAFAIVGMVEEDPGTPEFREALGGKWDAREVIRQISARHKADIPSPSIKVIADDFGREYARAFTVTAHFDPVAVAPKPLPTLAPGEEEGTNAAIFWGLDELNQSTVIQVKVIPAPGTLIDYTYDVVIEHPTAVGSLNEVVGSGAHFAAIALMGSDEVSRSLRARITLQRSTEDMIQFVEDLSHRAIEVAPSDASFGGPIDIAVITKSEDMRWIARKPNCR